MIARHLEPHLRQAARQFPVVHVTGPRQSGKTTLVKAVFPEHEYVSLEEPDTREFALSDPRGFLRRYRGDSILDEVQRAPDLPSYLQAEVDRDDSPGRFVLTGSQELALRGRVVQSLAGRVALAHLMPFSVAELVRREPRDPGLLPDIETPPDPPNASLEDLLFSGFYPRIHDRGLDPRQWLASYHGTYVERDVRQLLNIGDINDFQRFVALAAARSGQILSLSSLASDCGISQPTAKRWLSVLMASFLVTLLRPHHASFSKRLVKSPKLYFLDTGLLCYLLRATDSESLLTHPMRGAIFETFVVSELMKAFLNAQQNAPLYFWRDRTGHEVDVIVDMGAELVPVEVKAGRTIASDALSGLRYWLGLAGNANSRAMLVYAGEDTHERNRIAVIPWYALT